MRTARIAAFLFATLLVMAAAPVVQAHCQIPCGIYDDEARFTILREHVTTIEKSMNEINKLGDAKKNKNWNQLVRWVNNKEQHANELAEIVTYYFMAQRIKPPTSNGDNAANKKYQRELGQLHGMLVHAMKAKQTADLAHVKHLRDLIGKFEESYHGHSH